MWYPHASSEIFWLLSLFLLFPDDSSRRSPPGVRNRLTTSWRLPSPPAFSDWKTPQVPKDGSLGAIARLYSRNKATQPFDPARVSRDAASHSRSSLEDLQRLPNQRYGRIQGCRVRVCIEFGHVAWQRNEESTPPNFERFREYLKAKKKLIVSDVPMCLLAGQNMEQLPDRELVREALLKFCGHRRIERDEIARRFTGDFSRQLTATRSAWHRVKVESNHFDWRGVFVGKACRGMVVVIYLFATTSLPAFASVMD